MKYQKSTSQKRRASASLVRKGGTKGEFSPPTSSLIFRLAILSEYRGQPLTVVGVVSGSALDRGQFPVIG
jgi:hypothetical protein